MSKQQKDKIIHLLEFTVEALGLALLVISIYSKTKKR
jgi:hypothetical protein